MTYISQETSTEDGQPVELYLFFQKGGTNVTAYTSGAEQITYDGRVYSPQTIRRTSPQISQKLNEQLHHSNHKRLIFPLSLKW